MMRMLALAAVVVFANAAFAEDKKAKPSGNWVREVDGFEIRFAFKDDLVVTAKAGDAALTVTYKYEIDKEGVIKATVNEVKVKGDFPAHPEKGQEMSFKFTIDGKKAKLSDFKSKELGEAKDVLEGAYESKTD
jgi:hypothetical protein